MILTITSIKLRSPLMLYRLYTVAFQILNQLRASNCIAYKTNGSWTTHYTMSLWRNEDDKKDFAYKREHLNAMRHSANIAREIRTLSIEATEMPSWKEAKSLLSSKANILKY